MVGTAALTLASDPERARDKPSGDNSDRTSCASTCCRVHPSSRNHHESRVQLCGGDHAAARTIYIGAQIPVDGDGNIVGKGDVAAQTEQILRNINLCLEAAGARRKDLVSWTIYLVAGQPVEPAAGVGMRWLAGRADPPLNTVVFVSEWPNSDLLIMIEAVAVVAIA